MLQQQKTSLANAMATTKNLANAVTAMATKEHHHSNKEHCHGNKEHCHGNKEHHHSKAVLSTTQ